ncbi:MAG TPA: excalibur calcium-binding domain-containing protein [Candidatus Competibacter sp.]|nr:excalibur calcium-binding domain-containing protein [Candidatus Competibacter sp.]
MKKLVLIAIILAIGWYGNYLYKQHGSIFTQQSLTDLAYKKPTKCITKDGRILYGDLPQGTVCLEEKPVGGALTIMPSQNSSKVVTSSFKCDGRTHCSQMTSCEEATFFLRNCPNVKIDGNNDGVPCEKQWCGRF